MLEKFKKRLFRSMEKDDVDIEKLKEMAMKGAMIIDVRSPQEYNEGHIGGSILIPEYEINKTAKKIIDDEDMTIVVYCSSGARSKKAQKKLKSMGYQNVYNLYDGLDNSNLENYWGFKNSMVK